MYKRQPNVTWLFILRIIFFSGKLEILKEESLHTKFVAFSQCVQISNCISLAVHPGCFKYLTRANHLYGYHRNRNALVKKSAREFYVDNELRKAGNFAGTQRDRTDLQRGMARGGRGTRTVAAKSAASGTTNQIFAPTARSRGPLLLFICKAGLNYGGEKEATVAADSAARSDPLCYLLTGSIIVLLLP